MVLSAKISLISRSLGTFCWIFLCPPSFYFVFILTYRRQRRQGVALSSNLADMGIFIKQRPCPDCAGCFHSHQGSLRCPCTVSLCVYRCPPPAQRTNIASSQLPLKLTIARPYQVQEHPTPKSPLHSAIPETTYTMVRGWLIPMSKAMPYISMHPNLVHPQVHLESSHASGIIVSNKSGGGEIANKYVRESLQHGNSKAYFDKSQQP